MHAFLEAPLRNGTLSGRSPRDGINHARCAQFEQDLEQNALHRIHLAKGGVQGIRIDVIGHHTVDARLERCGAHHETSAQRKAGKGDVIEFEVVQDRFHGPMPRSGHVQARVVERATLARSLEGDHFIAGIAQVEKSRGQFFDIAVEAAEEYDRALGPTGCESVGRQDTCDTLCGVTHFVASELIESVD